MPDPSSSDALSRFVDSSRLALLENYADLLLDYNTRVNLISRKSDRPDVIRHIEHSLYLAQRGFPDGANVVDWGTGGGLPAIPLAIAFPDVQFTAVDSIGKKTTAVDVFRQELKLANIDVWHGRAEKFDGRANYSVSRATAQLSILWRWHTRIARLVQVTATEWTPGLLALKGGDLRSEIDHMRSAYPKTRTDLLPVAELAGEPVSDKFVVTVSRTR